MDLKLPIATPPWTLLGKELESKIRKALLEYSMIQEGEKIAVALSGGKDSLALLYLLHAIRGRGVPFFDLVAIHVEGVFSCGAGIGSTFLQGICQKMQVPLITQKAEIQKESLECYSCSRERRKLLFEGAKKEGAYKIAFGHHLDDSNQTLLLNLLHKAEFEPLEPRIYFYTYEVTLIRPLIFIEEKKIIQFAEQYGFHRVVCQCPYGQNSQRKKTKQLLERLEQVFPHTSKNLFAAGLKFRQKKALNPPSPKSNL